MKRFKNNLTETYGNTLIKFSYNSIEFKIRAIDKNEMEKLTQEIFKRRQKDRKCDAV